MNELSNDRKNKWMQMNELINMNKKKKNDWMNEWRSEEVNEWKWKGMNEWKMNECLEMIQWITERKMNECITLLEDVFSKQIRSF